MASLFEKMMQDFSKKDIAEMLNECMRMDARKMKRIPARYRLIAIGFLTKMSLEQLNTKLEENGCERLYARNPIEASLIYAFANGLSYPEWKKLEEFCNAQEEERGLEDRWFNQANVTYRELKEYVTENSRETSGYQITRKVTSELQERIIGSDSIEKFKQFMWMNWNEFRPVREKARYYFCKFLGYYIEEKIEIYLSAKRSGFGVEQAELDLNVLKGISQLKKRNMEEAEIRKSLDKCSISFGNLYDAFNYFYFGYISMDWMEVLLDYYGGDITKLGKEQKKELASALRSYDSKWKELSDEEIISGKWKELEQKERQLDQEYALNGGDRGYQKNRSGEKSVRNYIKGRLDLDRTTLICYLLFFGKEIPCQREQILTGNRLNQILYECGYSVLREQEEFDYFIIQYLEADDRVDYLMESVTRSAMEEKNFYLYHMYRESVNMDKQIKELMH